MDFYSSPVSGDQYHECNDEGHGEFILLVGTSHKPGSAPRNSSSAQGGGGGFPQGDFLIIGDNVTQGQGS